MISNYKNDNINTDYVYTAESIPSGSALIMIGGDGNNYITVAPGANYELKDQHIDRALDIMAGAGIVVLQHEIMTKTLEYVIHKAHDVGTDAMLNFAPAKDVDPACISKLSILVVNETEAQYLTGIPVVSQDNAPDAAELLKSMGIGTVIITLGINGSYVSSEDYLGIVPAYKVSAIDATAAGDVYCGTLATALMEDRSLQDAVRFSSAAAALCVTKLGAQPSAPSRPEIDDFMNNNVI
jgi:ribokinase